MDSSSARQAPTASPSTIMPSVFPPSGAVSEFRRSPGRSTAGFASSQEEGNVEVRFLPSALGGSGGGGGGADDVESDGGDDPTGRSSQQEPSSSCDKLASNNQRVSSDTPSATAAATSTPAAAPPPSSQAVVTFRLVRFQESAVVGSPRPAIDDAAGRDATRALSSSAPPLSQPPALSLRAERSQELLLQEFADVESCSKAFDANGQDFKTYYVPRRAASDASSSRNSTFSHEPSASSRPKGMAKTLSRRFDKSILPTKSFLGLGSKIFQDPAATPIQRTATITSPQQGAVSSSDQRSTFKGHAVVYFHKDRDRLVRSLFDVSSPFFVLGGSGQNTTSSSSRGSAPGGGRTLLPQQTAAALPSAARVGSSRFDGLDLFLPLALSQAKGHGERDALTVVLYKRPQADRKTVVELLYRLWQVEGPTGGGGCMHFEPVDVATIKERDPAAAADLEERRRNVIDKNFSIVSGKETGNLTLVSPPPPVAPWHPSPPRPTASDASPPSYVFNHSLTPPFRLPTLPPFVLADRSRPPRQHYM